MSEPRPRTRVPPFLCASLAYTDSSSPPYTSFPRCAPVRPTRADAELRISHRNTVYFVSFHFFLAGSSTACARVRAFTMYPQGVALLAACAFPADVNQRKYISALLRHWHLSHASFFFLYIHSERSSKRNRCGALTGFLSISGSSSTCTLAPGRALSPCKINQRPSMRAMSVCVAPSAHRSDAPLSAARARRYTGYFPSRGS